LEITDFELSRSFMMIVLEVTTPVRAISIVSGIAAILLLLIGSAMASGAEVAFFSLGPNQIRELRTHGTRANQAVLLLLEKPKRLLATLLIVNNFVNVSIVIISTYLTGILFNFRESSYWVAFLVQVVAVTSLILLFGEILPRVYATRNNLKFARFLAGPVGLASKIFYPLSSMLIGSTKLIDKRISRKAYNVSINELSDAIELATGADTPQEEKKILRGIVRLGDIEVKEIMKSRVDVTAVDISTGYLELLQKIVGSGYSRIPVYGDSIDQVRGILYIKDLLPHLQEGEDFDWKGLLRDALFVPENKKINDLLQEFQERKIHMAVVVDEYGGMSGIVTLEDIIEEIVGEISDEHDEPLETFEFTQIDDHHYIFEGKTSLNDFCKILDIGDEVFDDVRGESDSLAGLLLELLQRMPAKNEQVSYRQFTFTVKAVDKRRIKRVMVSIDISGSFSDQKTTEN